VSVVEAATEEQGVSFLASDVDFDGGKLILTAGAPKVTGEDEELLWDIATDMGPEHGCLWIYDTDDRQTVAFTSYRLQNSMNRRIYYRRMRSTGELFSEFEV